MTLLLLFYWLPVFVGVAFGARLVTRRRGTILGGLCALLWTAVVHTQTGASCWRDGSTLLSTVCGAAAILLIGVYGSAIGAESVQKDAGKPRASRSRPTAPESLLLARDLGPGTGDLSTYGRGFALQSMTSAFQQFDAWLEVHRYNDDSWADFDELLRSILFHWVGATHVRTYRVLSEGDQLIPLRELEGSRSSEVLSARRGVEGYVATTGRSFVSGDPTHGRLVEQLRSQPENGEEVQSSGPKVESRKSKVESFRSEGERPSQEHGTQHSALGTQHLALSDAGPAWCFAIVRGTRKVGVVTVERFDPFARGGATAEDGAAVPCPWSPAQLRLIELVVAQFWNTLTEVCRSRAAVTTDPGSGGLTRKAFFEVGREVLADAYRQGEPVTVAVVALEGLRGLDDDSQWETTDDLRATVCRILQQRLRADDRLGRFDDSRFVLLLRRVDSELGTLIMRELMGRLAEVPASRQLHGRCVELRCGLAGSGVTESETAATKPSLERLAGSALEACLLARQACVRISSDLNPVLSAG